MKKIFLIISLLVPFFSKAQSPLGVKFVKVNTLKEAENMAKVQNKKIFIDCYATWCIPCKQMETEVFNNSDIATYMNTKFISLKMQFDQNDKDSNLVKTWRDEVIKIQAKYQISAMPSFLFFDSNGNLILKEEGFKNSNMFLALAKIADDPTANYIGLLKRWRLGKISKQKLLPLAMMAKKYKDDEIALKIARQYKTSYFNKQQVDRLLKPETVDFINSFFTLFNVNDRFVKFVYRNPISADKSLGKLGFAKPFTDAVISKDLIDPIVNEAIQRGTEVNWKNIQKQIGNAFSLATANQLILHSKIGYFTSKKDWNEVIKYHMILFDTEGIDTVGIKKTYLNNLMYEVFFQHSNDSIILTRAAKIMEIVVKQRPYMYTYIDTYANLLYKLGKKTKAIDIENTALNLAKEKKDNNSVQEFMLTIEKMKSGRPTWDNN